MTDELKSVLAVALPVGALLVGAMVIYGPGARLEGDGGVVVYGYAPRGAIKQRHFAVATGDRPQDVVSRHSTKARAVRAGEKLARKRGLQLTIES